MEVLDVADLKERSAVMATELLQHLQADFTAYEASVFANACVMAYKMLRYSMEDSAGPLYILTEMELENGEN